MQQSDQKHHHQGVRRITLSKSRAGAGSPVVSVTAKCFHISQMLLSFLSHQRLSRVTSPEETKSPQSQSLSVLIVSTKH